MEISLDGMSAVDNHCHGFRLDQGASDPIRWRHLFTESFEVDMARDHVPTTLFYQRLIRQMASFFGCEATESAVLKARSTRDGRDLIRDLLKAAGLSALLVDQGFPPREELYPDGEITELTGIPTFPMLRLEVRMQDLVVELPTLEALETRWQEELQDIRGLGYVALKSIVAYRTGLEITPWPREEVAGAFTTAREEGLRAGRLRINHKPLIDHLLRLAFQAASRQEVPVQFHTGYGDSDTDLRLGNPLLLRGILEDPDLRGMPVVLLHESYPFTRMSGYLASVYGRVFTDLSYGIPYIGFGDMVAFTREALGVAPASKILYSSDGVGVPELHWASALHGRRVIGRVLGEAVEDGECSVEGAEAMARGILSDNAVRLYGLDLGS